MSSRRTGSFARLSPISPGRRRRRSPLGMLAVLVAVIAVTGAVLMWLVG